jgi:diguanylate cyclase (GGDEF)-like protein
MRIRLVILMAICLSLAPFLGGQIMLAEKNMQMSLSEAERNLQLSLVRANDLFGSVRRDLEGLSATVALVDSLQRVSPEGCGDTLRRVAAAYAQVDRISLLAPDGVVYCSSEPGAVGVSFADRRYFINSRYSSSAVWGDIQTSRINGKVTLASARAVRGSDGAVSFIVAVSLDLLSLKRQTFQQFQVPLSHAALIDPRGTILDAVALDEDAQPFDAATLNRIRTMTTGIIQPDTYSEGSSVIGVVSLPMTSGRVAFAMPVGDIYAKASHEMMLAVALVCLEALVIAAFLWVALELLILRTLRRMTEFASRITAGERGERVTIRSPFPEFSVLSSALNTMVDRLERASRTDALTGLDNRRALETQLLRWDARLDAGERFAIAMLDIDHFKRFNDRFGHGTGDSVLQMVAEALKRCITPDLETVARYGGEEFTVLLADDHPERIAERLDALRGAIEDMNIPHPDSPQECVTVSIGFAVARICGTAHETLERADAALYIAKARGRNRVERAARRPERTQDSATPPERQLEAAS